MLYVFLHIFSELKNFRIIVLLIATATCYLPGNALFLNFAAFSLLKWILVGSKKNKGWKWLKIRIVELVWTVPDFSSWLFSYKFPNFYIATNFSKIFQILKSTHVQTPNFSRPQISNSIFGAWCFLKADESCRAWNAAAPRSGGG